MMQVADDMHRMTNYIMDLRNMTIGLTAMTAVGILLFLLLKYYQGKQALRRGRSRNHRTYHRHNTDSEQSSLSRPGNGDRSSRHSQKHLDWIRQGIDMEKLMEQSQQSSRQTPPHQKPYAVNNNGNSLGLASGMPDYQPSPLPASGMPDYQPSPLPAPNVHSTPPVGGGGPLPVHQPNGGHVIKRLDPVKLTVDEVPYADS